jgi:hypothetical protein
VSETRKFAAILGGGTLMRALVLLFASSLARASSQAGEMAKQGSDSTTTYFVEIPTSVGQIEYIGIIRTESGDAMFDNMGVHSTGLSGEGFFAGHGKSTIIDSFGDKVFTTWEKGASHYVGGTGKYAGISGEGVWSCVHRPAPDGWSVDICQGKSNWKLR